MTVLHSHRRRIGPAEAIPGWVFTESCFDLKVSQSFAFFTHECNINSSILYHSYYSRNVYASWQRRVCKCVSSLNYPLSYGNNQLRGSCVQEIAELAVRNDLCRWAEYLLISHRLHRAAPANTSHRRRDITYTEMHLSLKQSLFH